MLPQGKKEEIKYKEFYDQYHYYMRSSTQKRYTSLFIPKGTEMLVWYEMWQYNDDMTDLQDMWRKGEKTFYLPNGIARYDIHISNKDVTIPMVLVSYRNEHGIPQSRIITDLYGEVWPIERDAHFGDVIYEPEPYGLWVKMYEKPTYIPELGTHIVAYGVYEENLPKVSECFKYGNQKHGIGNLTYRSMTGGIYQPITVDPNAPGQWSGTITYPTVFNNPAYNTWLKDNNINPISTTKGKAIINQNIPQPNNPSIKWTCQICGMDTSYVEYDYLGSGTNHLACEVKDTMKNIFQLEN